MSFSLLLELQDIKPSGDTTSVDSPEIKKCMGAINKIALMLFGREAGPVKDLKRSKEAKFTGVSHVKSKLVSPKKKHLHLTFDNSTDSTEFEINSLAKMMVVKGSDTDKKIRKLYLTYEVKSKKRTNYVEVDDQVVLREIHLGKHPAKNTVKLVKHLLKILRGEKEPEIDDQEDKPVDDEVKPEPKKVEKKPEEKKEIPKKEDDPIVKRIEANKDKKKTTFKEKLKESAVSAEAERFAAVAKVAARGNADEKDNSGESAETAVEFTEFEVAAKLSMAEGGKWSAEFDAHPKQVIKKGASLTFIKRIDGLCEYKVDSTNDTIRISETEVKKFVADGSLVPRR